MSGIQKSFILALTVAATGTACSSETKLEEVSIPGLRENLRYGQFINNKSFRKLAEDFSGEIDDVLFPVLLDCHTYYYSISEKAINRVGAGSIGDFKGLDLPKDLQYKYELGYQAIEMALEKDVKEIIGAQRGSMTSNEYHVYKQAKYSPTILRDCYWDYDPDAAYDSVIHEWYCADGYYERKANYELDEFVGNLPQFCNGLADSYLETGSVPAANKRFVLQRPEVNE